MAEAIAVNLRDMMILDTPIIVIVSGEGGSGGALGIAVGDRVLMQEYAIYSVIPPEGCAAILWRDPAKKVEAAEALKLTAPDLLKAGIIDEIIPEPIGGAHTDPAAAAAEGGRGADAHARGGQRPDERREAGRAVRQVQQHGAAGGGLRGRTAASHRSTTRVRTGTEDTEARADATQRRRGTEDDREDTRLRVSARWEGLLTVLTPAR